MEYLIRIFNVIGVTAFISSVIGLLLFLGVDFGKPKLNWFDKLIVTNFVLWMFVIVSIIIYSALSYIINGTLLYGGG